MFNIDQNLIRRECVMPRTFERGMAYYRQGRVKSLRFHKNNMVVEATVQGSKSYSTYASFTQRGDIIEAGCTCPAARKYWGWCKHIVALLFTIMDHDKRGSFEAAIEGTPLDTKRGASLLFDNFDYTARIVNRKPIKLDITYEVNVYEREMDNIAGFLSIKIGGSRLYVVRNIAKLIQAFKSEEPLEFGKNFTYDPSIHTFNPVDEKVMNLLKEIYEIHWAVEDKNYYSPKGIIDGKTLMLPHTLSKRFLNIMEGRSFHLVMGHDVFENIKIVDKDLPISFELDRYKNDLLLEVDFKEEFVPLTYDKDYILVGDKIYKPSRRQLLSYLPLRSTLVEMGGTKIRFSKEDRDRFVSEILPLIEYAGPVNIKPEVKSIILKEELLTELYLRPLGRGIACQVKFIYGTREINPFGGNSGSHSQDEQILIRDSKKEQKILSILNEYGFSVQPGEVYLEEEEAIFDFIYSGIPVLQQIAHVYYSEDFKNYMTSRSFYYSGGIRLNTQMDILEFNFEVDDIDFGELEDIFAAFREKKRYYRLKDGTFLNLESEELYGIANLGTFGYKT